MIDARGHEFANCHTRQSGDEMNTTCQSFEHVARIKKSVDSENEAHNHDKDGDNGK
jgi:hypothetical protein